MGLSGRIVTQEEIEMLRRGEVPAGKTLVSSTRAVPATPADALKMAHHALTTLTGLRAWDYFGGDLDDAFEIDESDTIAAIDEALEGLKAGK